MLTQLKEYNTETSEYVAEGECLGYFVCESDSCACC